MARTQRLDDMLSPIAEKYYQYTRGYRDSFLKNEAINSFHDGKATILGNVSPDELPAYKKKFGGTASFRPHLFVQTF